MKINRNRYSHNFKSTIFIDFQYQSINCYWLLLIIIDFIDYRKPLIDNAGNEKLLCDGWMLKLTLALEQYLKYFTP